MCEREKEGKMPLAVQKRPSPVQSGLCERERESGRGKGREKCHWLSRKGLALFKMACVRERERGRGKGRERKGLDRVKKACVREREREREREWEREGEGKVPLAVLKM